jgi:hypothetical protein
MRSLKKQYFKLRTVTRATENASLTMKKNNDQVGKKRENALLE